MLGSDCSYIDLRIVPLVHAQGLDLGDVCAELAVQGRASHAQEDAQLQADVSLGFVDAAQAKREQRAV